MSARVTDIFRRFRDTHLVSPQQNLIPPTSPTISERIATTSQHDPPPLNNVIIKIATPPPVEKEEISTTLVLHCHQEPDGSSSEDLAIEDLSINNNASTTEML